jgi:hypothetical protein
VLKRGGHAVYNISAVDDHNSENTKKWICLYMSLDSSYHPREEKMNDIQEWLAKCQRAGYGENDAVKVYGELPAPEGDVFPFENEVLQWMAAYVVVSQK